jgi:hypothetical protein
VERRDRDDGCGGTTSNDVDGGGGETDHDVGDLILRRRECSRSAIIIL